MDFGRSLEELIEEIKEKALNHYGENLVSLVIFGSVAKGKATPESDVDILIVLENKPGSSYETYMDFYENVESRLESLNKLGMRLSPVFLRRASLKEEIPWLWDTEFIVLHDKGGFFRDFLKRLERFKSRLELVKKPMPHFVVKDGK